MVIKHYKCRTLLRIFTAEFKMAASLGSPENFSCKWILSALSISQNDIINFVSNEEIRHL